VPVNLGDGNTSLKYNQGEEHERMSKGYRAQARNDQLTVLSTVSVMTRLSLCEVKVEEEDEDKVVRELELLPRAIRLDSIPTRSSSSSSNLRYA
jgi:hypothetical protein